MSAITTLSDRVKGQYHAGLGVLRKRLFGANNERLDLMMDSFNKLEPSARALVVGLAGLAIAGIVVGAIVIYVYQVDAVKTELNDTFRAVHELETLKKTYEIENKKFEKLVKVVKRKTGKVKAKPFFEKIAKELGVKIDSLTEKKVPLETGNPLSGKMQEVHVEVRFPAISIPRLMQFMIEVEKRGTYFRVNDFNIRGRYGTRLKFDGVAKFRGYDVNG